MKTFNIIFFLSRKVCSEMKIECSCIMKDVDIVITTALIPGKKAPILIKKYMIGMLAKYYHSSSLCLK
jgi:NAD/NADP transhydrogenase alpha subunit